MNDKPLSTMENRLSSKISIFINLVLFTMVKIENCFNGLKVIDRKVCIKNHSVLYKILASLHLY
ncbi:MAG: hypothetical protein ACI97N_000873 [Cognaticolwellia sp.]|jgi:hypothetical protein